MTNILRTTHTRPDGTTFTTARIIEDREFVMPDRPANRSMNYRRGARKSTRKYRTIL